MSRAPRPTDAARSARTPRTLVIGLGNPILSDDGVGVHVVRRLRSRLGKRPGIELAEDCRGGLRLMERMIGYDRALVIDAGRTGRPPGEVRVLSLRSLPTLHAGSAHDLDLPTALAVGRRAGAALPDPSGIRFLVIESQDVLSFGEQCTPAVAAAIDRAARVALDLLSDWR